MVDWRSVDLLHAHKRISADRVLVRRGTNIQRISDTGNIFIDDVIMNENKNLIVEIARSDSEVLLARVVEVHAVLRATLAGDDLLFANILVPFLAQWSTDDFDQLLNLKGLRVSVLEAYKWLCLVQMRSTFLDEISDVGGLDFAHPSIVRFRVLLFKCLIDELHDAVFGIRNVSIDFPRQAGLLEFLDDFVRIREILEISVVVHAVN